MGGLGVAMPPDAGLPAMSAEEKRVVSELVGVTGASNDTALQVLRECRGDAQETANRLLDISARPARAARGVAHAARRAAACRTRHVHALPLGVRRTGGSRAAPRPQIRSLR